MVLMAQAVPSATSVPCMAALPAGWELGGLGIKRGEASFWLDSDRAGDRAVDRHVAAAVGLPHGRGGRGAQRRVGHAAVRASPSGSRPSCRSTRYYRFAGGCVTYEFDFGADADTELLFAADSALAFQPRRRWSTTVADAHQRAAAVRRRTRRRAPAGAEARP